MENYKKTFPALPRSECLCPEFAPNSLGRLYCSDHSNNFYGRIPSGTAFYDNKTITAHDFLVEYMNDGNILPYVDNIPFTFWISSPDTERFTVEIDFENMYMVRY